MNYRPLFDSYDWRLAIGVLTFRHKIVTLPWMICSTLSRVEATSSNKWFFCSIALASTGWVLNDYIKPRHCPSPKRCGCHWIFAKFSSEKIWIKPGSPGRGPWTHPLCYEALYKWIVKQVCKTEFHGINPSLWLASRNEKDIMTLLNHCMHVLWAIFVLKSEIKNCYSTFETKVDKTPQQREEAPPHKWFQIWLDLKCTF